MMVRIATFFFLVIFCLSSGFGQVPTGIIEWKRGVILKKSDFKNASGEGSVSEHLAISINSSSYGLQGTWGNYQTIITTKAVLNTNASFLPDTTDLAMRYTQILFDLSGYQSLLLNLRASESKKQISQAGYDSLYYNVEAEVRELKSSMDREMQAFGIKSALSVWDEKITDLIKQTPDIEISYVDRKIGVGMFLGMGAKFLTGEAKSYFTNTAGVNMDLIAETKKSRFGIDFNISSSKSKRAFYSKGDWEIGQKTSSVAFEFTYGQKLMFRKNLFIPYLGVGIIDFSPRKAEKGDRRNATSYAPVIGIEFDRYLKELLDFSERSNILLRARASVSLLGWGRAFDGGCVNLRLSIGMVSYKNKGVLTKVYR